MSELRHECGVAAVYWLHGGGRPAEGLSEVPRGEVSRLIPRMLLDMQNRGQLAAGLSSYCPTRVQILDTYKDVGGVHEVFRLGSREAAAIMDRYAGPAAIGHVRYATCGLDERSYAQPFERHHGRRWKWFSFCFNGNLANFAELKRDILRRHDYHIIHNTDTEVLMHCIAYELRGDRKPDLLAVFRRLSRRLDGAYNIVFLNSLGEMAVARDPLGLRPLVYGRSGRLFAAASESVALTNLGFRDIRPVEPGTVILIEEGRLRIERFARASHKAHCFFEWIYFANVASTLDERSVYVTRWNLGRELARIETQPIDRECIVVPVPDTAKAAADAMAFHLGIPSLEGLMRNRYLGRTFIEGRDRAAKARLKYTALPEVLAGKRVFLVEDSIVRCTTLRTIVEQIRRCGVKELHVRVACPPIIAPCFYGIDMSTMEELFAPKRVGRSYAGRLSPQAEARMAREIGADSLKYLPVEAISRCIEIPAEDLCRGCITGRYPTPQGRRLFQRARQRRPGRDGGKRTYE